MSVIHELMRQAVECGASDIHLKTGNPPIFRVNGSLKRQEGAILSDDDIESLLAEVVSENERQKFSKIKELDTSYMVEGLARFRINVCKDDGDTRMVLRVIPTKIKTIDDLELPPVLKDICDNLNGLVLITGVTGSGKSTTLAAMIDVINSSRPLHIVTVEDPIEFLHTDKESIITQREVGQDTMSFVNALRGALRQDPDIILIGEMRDAETVRTALSSAETGHLVFSTLHTVDAVETLHRIMDFFEPHQQEQIRKQLASVLRAIISQRLIPTKDGLGRRAAAEILIGNRTVRDFIEQGRSFKEIVGLIEEGGSQYGMQTFDHALYTLWSEDKISEQIALANATSPRDLKLRFQGLAAG